MPTPLRWKDTRPWNFTTLPHAAYPPPPTGHINLFTNLIKDWVSAPPADFYRFMPTVYQICIAMTQFKLMLYLNDHNIVDDPFDPGKNRYATPSSAFSPHLTRSRIVFFTLSGPTLISNLTIPSSKSRLESTLIPFSVEVPNGAASMTLPNWNPNSVFGCLGTTDIRWVVAVQLDGSCLSWAEVRQEIRVG